MEDIMAALPEPRWEPVSERSVALQKQLWRFLVNNVFPIERQVHDEVNQPGNRWKVRSYYHAHCIAANAWRMLEQNGDSFLCVVGAGAQIPPVIERLKAKAQQAGLWNLFLPDRANGGAGLRYYTLFTRCVWVCGVLCVCARVVCVCVVCVCVCGRVLLAYAASPATPSTRRWRS
jgi:hypothetical protein